MLTGEGEETEPVEQAGLELPAGQYVVEWTADKPFQPGYDTCGVILDMYTESGIA